MSFDVESFMKEVNSIIDEYLNRGDRCNAVEDLEELTNLLNSLKFKHIEVDPDTNERHIVTSMSEENIKMITEAIDERIDEIKMYNSRLRLNDKVGNLIYLNREPEDDEEAEEEDDEDYDFEGDDAFRDFDLEEIDPDECTDAELWDILQYELEEHSRNFNSITGLSPVRECYEFDFINDEGAVATAKVRFDYEGVIDED